MILVMKEKIRARNKSGIFMLLNGILLLESRRLEEWDYNFIRNIVDARLQEWTTLEYKKEFPANESDRNRLEHTICAFANTRGGYVIIGIEADKVENVPLSMKGIEDSVGLYEKITSFCGRLTPRITPKIQKISIPNSGSIFLIVYVSESNEAHMASDGKYYVRINSQSLPADHYTVEKLFRKEYEFKERMREILDAKRQKFEAEGPLWEIVYVLPFGFKDDLIPIFDEKSGTLRKDTTDFLMKTQPILRSWDHRPTQFSFLQFSKSQQGKLYGFVEVSQNGLIEIGERIDYTPLYPAAVKEFLEKTLAFAEQVYTFSRHDGSVRIILDLLNMKNKELGIQGFHLQKYIYSGERLTIQRDVALNDLRNNREKFLNNMSSELIRSFGVNIFDKE